MTIQLNESLDRLFRHFMSNINIAKEFLDLYLPDKVKENCDFSTLCFIPDSFVEKDLKHYYSDVLYTVKIAGSQSYIYTLIQYATKPNQLTSFDLLRYQLAIMQQHLDQGNETLPIVVPLLIYNGKESPCPFTNDILDCFADRTLAEETFFKILPIN